MDYEVTRTIAAETVVVTESLQFIPITTVSLLGLLLPYRKFFPR
jgi:hypothetical protein